MRSKSRHRKESLPPTTVSKVLRLGLAPETWIQAIERFWRSQTYLATMVVVAALPQVESLGRGGAAARAITREARILRARRAGKDDALLLRGQVRFVPLLLSLT
jgi:hypothetical protein